MKLIISLKTEYTDDVLYAQAASFFTAGFETSSTTITFALYELARAPEKQKQLRNEIHEYLRKNNNNVNYDTLSDMKYLDMVVTEVLRLYPPLPFLDRTCQPDDKSKGYSIKNFIDFSIPKDMPVFIPISAIHRDSKYYPNPDQFEPERFSDKSKIEPYTYMPFGIGPRNCIGERFGLIQTKLGILYFLKNNIVVMNSKTPRNMILEPKALIIQSKETILLDIVRDEYKL